MSVVKFKYTLAIVAVLAVVLMMPKNPGAAEKSPFQMVTVMGTSTIRNNDVVEARNEAISNGLDSAIGHVIVGQLTPDYMLRHFETIHQVIYDHTETFVQDYKVLTEAKSGKAYRVLVRATVSIARLEEQLAAAGVLLSSKALPSILILIAEQKIEDPIPRHWWGQTLTVFENISENALAEVLGEKGFAVINPIRDAQGLSLQQNYQKLDLSNDEIVKLGLYLKADVVLVGRATVQQTANIMEPDIRSYKAVLTARALRIDTKQELIPLSTQEAVAAHMDEVIGSRNALATAGSLFGEQISARIAGAWLREDIQPSLVTLVIGGTSKLKNFELFQQQMAEISGINELRVQELKPDEIILLVDYQDSAHKLALALMLKTFDEFGLNIYEVQQDHIFMEMVPQ